MSDRAAQLRRFHLIATVAWGVVLVVAILAAICEAAGWKIPAIAWLLGVAFISLCSIYANMVGHWASYQGARSEAGET